MFDTGSSYTWVPSISCLVASCLQHRRFNPELSATFSRAAAPATATAAAAAAAAAAPQQQTRVTLQDFALGFAVSQPEHPFSELPFDGIIGLGTVQRFPQQQQQQQQKKWELRLWDVLVDEATVGVCTPQLPCTAIVDTGTSGIGGSAALVERIIDRMGGYESLCGGGEREERNKNMKRLAFVLEPAPGDDPQQFALDPDDYNAASYSFSPPSYSPLSFYSYSPPYSYSAPPFSYSPPYSSSDCNSTFMALPLPAGQSRTIVLGDVFLRKFYAVFDYDNSRIGIAERTREQNVTDPFQLLQRNYIRGSRSD
ncbi:eukaryotic aspartyl protease, putative [Eimeria brunetti]|uniref:Eukaryotic aspartyl protease, putative n=1 Tax=Eimeria brunetti TaxID=51314 RepID=U6LGM0_9EIME|nr:eukaryotic aspartyl protease, putative [Eimeria brunetti]